ncbi:MAG: hydrogenase maturation protein [Pseudomonadota bacterium]
MRILLLCHSFNSLTQRVFVALDERGHEVSVEYDINDANTAEAVLRFQPDLIVAPFLKRKIPASVWSVVPCFIVHPGVVGDRGPSALDWAVMEGRDTWGVTVLQANEEFDAGTVWASRQFTMRAARKASIYRSEVTRHAVDAIVEAVGRYQSGQSAPPQQLVDPDLGWRPLIRQSDRHIDWQCDDTETVLRKIRSADGFPGVSCELGGRQVRVFDAREAPGHQGAPGRLLAMSGPAVLVGTRDNALWIGHALDRASTHRFKLPASLVLSHACEQLPRIPPDSRDGYTEIRTQIRDEVVYLHFDFYNGAMSAGQCARLLSAFICARETKPKVIVLAGGSDFWSNGMHLNLIEASDQPADASWANINAINDLSHEIITTTECLTVAALHGNAGAGGVFLARAADQVWAHADTVLNPHYKDMGNLYGSEYWTYLLPRSCGKERAQRVIDARLPIGVRDALSLGLVDDMIADSRSEFPAAMLQYAQTLATSDTFNDLLDRKHAVRLADEARKPLADYRREELERMRENFYGFDPSYHIARYNFVHKVPRSHTPLTLARHRSIASREDSRQAS